MQRLAAAWGDVGSGCQRAFGSDGVTGDCAVFNHDHAVCAFRHRCSGHDFDGSAWGHGAGENGTGGNFTDDFEGSRQVGGADGEPIADGAVEGRQITICGDVLGEDAEMRFAKRDRFDGGAKAGIADFAQNGCSGFGEGECRHRVSV